MGRKITGSGKYSEIGGEMEDVENYREWKQYVKTVYRR